jgi:hypothetical protein
MLGNALSSSPSNTPPPYERARFPSVTVLDQRPRPVSARDGALRDRAAGGGDRLVDGSRADLAVGRQLPRDGAVLRLARTSPHNIVFLEGVKGALEPRLVRGAADRLRAMARVYAGWALLARGLPRDFSEGFASLTTAMLMLWTCSTGTSAARRASTLIRADARGNRGAGHRDARGEGSLLPPGQRVRGSSHVGRRAPFDPRRLGPLRRRWARTRWTRSASTRACATCSPPETTRPGARRGGEAGPILGRPAPPKERPACRRWSSTA